MCCLSIWLFSLPKKMQLVQYARTARCRTDWWLGFKCHLHNCGKCVLPVNCCKRSEHRFSLFPSDEELETAVFFTGRKHHELLQVRFGDYVCLFCFAIPFRNVFINNVCRKDLKLKAMANTRPRVETRLICSLWNSMPSLLVSRHAAFPLGRFIHADRPQDDTAHPIAILGLSLPLFDSFFLTVWISTVPKDTDS